MDWYVENSDLSGGHFFMNSHTLYEANNHNSDDSKQKRGGNFSGVSEMKYTGLQDGVEIDSMSYSSTFNQYSNM